MTASSFSRSQGANLPGTAPSAQAKAPDARRAFDQNRDPSIAAQLADKTKTEAQRREAFMVARDRPQPVQRPSPALAHGSDAAAFNTRWKAERDVANREARNAAFVAARSAKPSFHKVSRNPNR